MGILSRLNKHRGQTQGPGALEPGGAVWGAAQGIEASSLHWEASEGNEGRGD